MNCEPSLPTLKGHSLRFVVAGPLKQVVFTHSGALHTLDQSESSEMGHLLQTFSLALTTTVGKWPHLLVMTLCCCESFAA